MHPEAAYDYVGHIGGVEGLDAPERPQSVVEAEERQGGEDHAPHNGAGGSCPDVDAVPYEGRGAEGRHNPKPDQERQGSLDNIRLVCHQGEHPLAANDVDNGGGYRNP